ncbi:unnamed protein product, partial [Prorocentrum cordatum]
MAPTAGTALRVIGYNPMWASGLRTQEILHHTTNYDAVLLCGTQTVCRKAEGVLRSRVAGRTILEAVHQPGPLTTAATGCAVILRAGYNDRHIRQTWFPPRQLAGRGLAVRIQKGAIDITYGVLYYPPQPRSHQENGVYHETVKALTRWWRSVLMALPCRTLPLFYSDVNGGIGAQVKAGVWTEPPCGALGPTRSRERRRNGAGESVRHLLVEQKLISATSYSSFAHTYWSSGNPSTGSMIDYWFLPRGWLERLRRSHIVRDLGDTLQPIRGIPPRDHIPVLLELSYEKDAGALPPAPPPRLSGDAMTAAILRGEKKPEFSREVTQQLSDNEEHLRSLADQNSPDALWEALETIMTTAGISCSHPAHLDLKIVRSADGYWKHALHFDDHEQMWQQPHEGQDRRGQAPRGGLKMSQLEEMFDSSAFLEKVPAIARDQAGCRMLQHKLEKAAAEGNSEVVNRIFNEVLTNCVDLMMDPFGNYLCQKLMEICSYRQLELLMEKSCAHLVRISLNLHGARVVQKLIDAVSKTPHAPRLVAMLQGAVVQMSQDPNGNHVVNKCLEALPAECHSFVFQAVAASVVDVASHRHGCRIVQRCIDSARGAERRMLIGAITREALTLVQDPFGNYVVQHTMQLNDMQATSDICRNLLGRLNVLSRQKFSSNVVEACLRTCRPEDRERMIAELADSRGLG